GHDARGRRTQSLVGLDHGRRGGRCDPGGYRRRRVTRRIGLAMAAFEYTGIEAGSGKAVKGYRDAENVRALRTVLRKDGVLLTSAVQGAKAATRKKGEVDLLAFVRRISGGDVAVMTRQLATLVRAGIPLVDSI